MNDSQIYLFILVFMRLRADPRFRPLLRIRNNHTFSFCICCIVDTDWPPNLLLVPSLPPYPSAARPPLSRPGLPLPPLLLLALSISLFLSLSIYLSLFLSLSIYLSFSISLFPSIDLSISLPAPRTPHPAGAPRARPRQGPLTRHLRAPERGHLRRQESGRAQTLGRRRGAALHCRADARAGTV